MWNLWIPPDLSIWQFPDRLAIELAPLWWNPNRNCSRHVWISAQFWCKTSKRIPYNFRLERRFDASRFQRFPVDFAEERMCPDRVFAAGRRHTAQSLRWILRHELKAGIIMYDRLRLTALSMLTASLLNHTGYRTSSCNIACGFDFWVIKKYL